MISQLQRVIDDTSAALARVERQAEADRLAAAAAADNMDAEFARELEAEIAERQLREKELADAQIALQRAEQRRASERADASDALRHAEARRDAAAREHRRLFDQAPAGLCRVTSDGAMSLANQAFAQFLGYKTPEQLLKVDLASTVFESADELQWIIERCLASRRTESIETSWSRKDGSRILVRVVAAATMADEIEMTAEDVTPQRVLEEKLRLSQRMEAVARYGAEVAVTCDSLLTQVEQEGRRWLAGSSDGAAARYRGELWLDEVARAAQYMRRLAAYGKEENKVSGVVDLRKILTDLEPVLRRVAGSDIEVALPQEASPLNLDVEAEPVERMLINVAAYGRERMALGGRLTFQLAPIVVDRRFTAKYPNVRPGAHVLLTVNETRNAQRVDIAPAEQTQTAAGSARSRRGVDLATLQALVSGCGGHLWMMAEPRGDMTLKIRLPRRMLDDPQIGANGFAPARWMKRAVSLLT
jgi:PAS domain S-box-containing protein